MRRARLPVACLVAALVAGCGADARTVVRGPDVGPTPPTSTGTPPVRDALDAEDLDATAALLRRRLEARGARVERAACQTSADGLLGCEVVAESRGQDVRRFAYEARPTRDGGYDFSSTDGQGFDPEAG